MMSLNYIDFQDLMCINTIHSHFYIDNNSNKVLYVNDGLQLRDNMDKDLFLLEQVNSSTFQENPFGMTPELDRQKSQLLVINDVAYEMKAAINDETHMTHYIVMPFDLTQTENQVSLNEIKSSLSNRETEILILIADGLSMTKIANRLSISPHTVDTHRVKLCKKLKVRRTTQLAVWAYKLGLIHDFNHHPVST